MEKYIKNLEKNQYSINTIKTYKSVLNIYKNELNNLTQLKKKLTTYYDEPNTAWTHYNIICSYLKWNKDKRLETLRELKLPKISKKYMKTFTKEFLYKRTTLVENDANQNYKKIVIRFLFETGIRAAELYEIISYDKKTLIIKGKGNKIREVFHKYETTKEIGEFKYTSKTLRLWVKEILGEQYTPHSIRRSHATYLLLNGANPKMVMMQLGHEKIETTFRYLQLSIKENQKIYNKFY